jgi:N,N'-diacetyllegionaminate synthase
MRKTIQLGTKRIGEKQPCFIIAEAGVNHNGKIQIAKKLIDVAVDADADAVKFQIFKAENVTTRNTNLPKYATRNIRKKTLQIDLLRQLEIKYENFIFLKKYCDRKSIIFLATPHSFDAIDFLENLVPAYKFGSGDITNIPALVHAAKKGKPLILGTGASTLQEIRDAIQAIKHHHNQQVIALHCTTNYPCPIEEVNLRAMRTMRQNLDCLVGYSDHTLGTIVSIAAVALGACVIEKHFTLDRGLPGPDHKASLEPDELKEMVKAIRDTETALGSEEKKPQQSEKEIIKIARKSIVAQVNIPKGKIIQREMLAMKRPGTGLNGSYYEEIIGKRTKNDIKKDELITWKVLEK